jgi:hypothetical protein
MSRADLRRLEREWIEEFIPSELRGLSLEELRHAALAGVALSESLARDLEDLSVALDAAERSPCGGYDELLDEFGTLRREGLNPHDVVRRWCARYGGFLVTPTNDDQLLLPLAGGAWAACDGKRLWRISRNPFDAL